MRQFAAAVFLVLLASPVAAQQVAWRSGLIAYTPATDFITGFSPQGTGYYVSQAHIVSPPQPVVGQAYYVSIDMAGIVSPAVGRLMAVHFVPPAGTSVVSDPAVPVRCYYAAMDGSPNYVEFTNQVLTDVSFGASLRIFGCPQPSAGAFPLVGLSNGAGTAFLFDRRDPQRPNDVVWPMGSQARYRFLIPVVSNRAMDGFSTGNRFIGAIQSIQGDGLDPWAFPELALLVHPGAAGSADMRASISTAASPLAGHSRVIGRCTNFGPDVAQNASCSFGPLPAGALMSCQPASPQATLAPNAAIECITDFPFQSGGVSIEVTAASATADPQPVNNGVGVSLQPAGGSAVFRDGFEGG